MDDVHRFGIPNFHALIMFCCIAAHCCGSDIRITAMKTLALILALAIAAPLAAHADNAGKAKPVASWIQNQNNLLAPY
jgi:multisubunit Na+/H+ antiporter MnhG subunit